MKTDSFLASFIFPSDGKTALRAIYNQPRKSEKPIEVTPHKTGGNCFYKTDCHFSVYAVHNKEIMAAELKDNDGLLREHIVSNPNAEYEVVAFLEEDEGHLTNSIDLVATLPVGLKMTRLEIGSDSAVFVFSGLSIMLFDTATKSKTDQQ